MRVAVVIPTIRGREADFDRCVNAYRKTAPAAKLYIERDRPSCGEAWIQGAKRAARNGFDYLHLTADDLEPHDGWLEPAIETADRGMIPAPLVYHPSGVLESAGLAGFSMNGIVGDDWQPIEGTTVPFLTREMWRKVGMIPVHYCSDLYVSTIGRRYGWETVIRTGMCFTHHTAQPGRDYGRVGGDTAEYLRLIS